MKILITFILLFSLSAFAQNSYVEILKEGEGEVTIGFHNFTTEINEKNESGFEYELMTLFLDYVESKKEFKSNEIINTYLALKVYIKMLKKVKLILLIVFLALPMKEKRKYTFHLLICQI